MTSSTGRPVLLNPLVLALWLALTAGLIEGSIRLIQSGLFHRVISVSPHVIWMAPLANLVWLGVPAVGLLLLERMLRPRNIRVASTRVLLTIGAKQLKYFAGLHDRLTLFARILPAVTSLQQALQAGFPQAHILCLRPPFSQDFNQSILREYHIDVLLTKASGVEGGVVEKVLAAHDLAITTLMIRRPEDDLPTVSSAAAAVQACRDFLHGARIGQGEA